MRTAQLVRCHCNGQGCCWLQLDGSHVSPKACKCHSGEIPGYLCPIDGHAIRWLQQNPDFGEASRPRTVVLDLGGGVKVRA